MKFYDEEKGKLIVFEKEATDKFWDEHWQTGNFNKEVEGGRNDRFVRIITNKFLKPGTRILEGGCGRGQVVYGLSRWGYDAYGVDFAEETVKKINENFPELKVSSQDVRKLNFPANFFDGYWSIGVIEHFWKGYEEIIREAKRVIKNNGYLFLTFPYISPLRRIKIKLRIYKKLDIYNSNNFYQFVLDKEDVARNLEKYGLKLISEKPYDATKGLKDEISFLNPILQIIYDSQNVFLKGVRFLISVALSHIAGHCVLLVLKKCGEEYNN